MFKIGDFARINRVTVKTLRHYDSIGLLRPVKIDNFTGYRYYSANQMPKLNRILVLKDVGFSLEEIFVILDKDIDYKELQTILEIKHAEITGKILDEQARLSRVENLIKISKQEAFKMNYDVVIKNIDPIRVAALRDTIPSYSEQGHLWKELGEYIQKHNVKIVPPCMVSYHLTGYKEESIDTEIYEPIIGELPENGRIKVKILEGVKEMACVVHKGSYQTLHMAYSSISKWIEDNTYEIIGPPRELYIKGDWETNDINEYITEIQFPIRKMMIE